MRRTKTQSRTPPTRPYPLHKKIKILFLGGTFIMSPIVLSEEGISIPGPTNRDGGYIRTPRINWHHSWLFVLTRRHSWCQLILGVRISPPSLSGSRYRYIPTPSCGFCSCENHCSKNLNTSPWPWNCRESDFQLSFILHGCPQLHPDQLRLRGNARVCL